MRAIEFNTTLNNNKKIDIPVRFQKEVEKNNSVRVLILIEELSDEQAWKKLNQTTFLSGYSEKDSIYDNE